MKQSIIFLLALLTNIGFAGNLNMESLIAQSPVFLQIIELPAGTVVLLESAEEIKSDQVTVGRIINFIVRTNVDVNGETVIRTGAIATGRIKSITSSTYNNPEEIKIELKYVQAVDGQQVALHGIEANFYGKFPGESASVDPGMSVNGHVMNNTKIRL